MKLDGLPSTIMPPSAVTDLWSQNLISISMNPNTSVTKIGWNSIHWVESCEIRCSQGFWVIACCDPWPLNFWHQNLISTSTNPNTSVTKIVRNSLHWFLRYGVHKVFGMHRCTHSRSHPWCTHSQTDRPECSMPRAPFFNSGRGTKVQKWKVNNKELFLCL